MFQNAHSGSLQDLFRFRVGLCEVCAGHDNRSQARGPKIKSEAQTSTDSLPHLFWVHRGKGAGCFPSKRAGVWYRQDAMPEHGF